MACKCPLVTNLPVHEVVGDSFGELVQIWNLGRERVGSELPGCGGASISSLLEVLALPLMVVGCSVFTPRRFCVMFYFWNKAASI